ncbi:glucose-6-phosphate isomerase, partial [Acinetobacter baumannii]
MDQHFLNTAFNENIPVILGLLGIWTASFLNLDNHLIIPYTDALGGLPEYLQQLEMESNGKRVSNQNELVTYQTAPL